MTQICFHIKTLYGQRLTNNKQHNDIRNEEGSATVLVRHKWKTPDIAETNGIRYAGHQELEAVRPHGSL